MVERVCGTPPEQFRAVCEAWTANSNRERTTALVYSVGWTQHSVGAQYIRSGAIIQLLLGNIGRPGGGVFALRGHASIQGSTDIPTLFNLLPGYLPMPSAESSDDLDTYLDAVRSRTQKGYWSAADTYMVSLLKEYFGEHATAENDFGFDLLPRISGDHGTYRTVMDMVDGGKVFGYFLLGQNPAVGSAHGKLQRLGMANLDWVVVRDLAMIESATFWKDSPEIETGEISPETCRTEVFFFPAASHVEKEGTFTQTQRMVQWRDKAVEPTGDQRSDLWFFYHLGRMVKERLAASTDPRDEPVQKLDWSYHVDGLGATLGGAVGRRRPAADQRLRRRHRHGRRQLSRAQGRRLHRLRLLDLLRRLRGRGEPGRAPQAALGAGPVRRRVGLDVAREPPRALQPRLGGPGRQAVERAQEARVVGRGEGASGPATTSRTSRRPPRRATSRRRERPGPKACAATTRSSCRPTARRGCSLRTAWWTGRCPRTTRPTSRRCATRSTASRATRRSRSTGGRTTRRTRTRASPGTSSVFPFVLTTARLTEHHTAGGMSRQLPYLSELQPELFVEVSPELARMRGLTHLGVCHVVTSRAVVQARVTVTDRMAPLRVDGQVVHQVWMPYHWGSNGVVTGDVVNDLFGVVADPNVFIQESKVATCDVRPGPRPRGAQMMAMLRDLRTRAGITVETGTVLDTAAGSPHIAHVEEGAHPAQGPSAGVTAASHHQVEPSRSEESS